MSRPSNLLFFFTDDQRFDTIRALGNDQIHTPNLDRLVASGTAFTRAHIPGGTCGAVCMPSRAMLHTGRGLFHLEREGQDIPSEHTTLGECFQQAGYKTFGVGKWHNGKTAYARSFTCGAEIFFGGMEDHWNVPVHRFDPTGRYDTTCPVVPDPWSSNAVTFRDCDHVVAGKHSTDLFTDAAIQFIREQGADGPFLTYVSLMAPHDPRTMPERFLNLYNPTEITLPENFLPEHSVDTGALRIRDELLAAFPRDPGDIRRHIAEYYAMISHLDEAFGRIIHALQEAGVFDNTLIVVAGDNGLALGQHGLMGKQNLYDHSVRVPLILAGPGIPKGVKRESLVYLLDLFPTLCDLTGLDVPASVEGRSFRSCLNDPGARVREDLYLAYADSLRGITDGKFKLIEYACGVSQLFNLRSDPLERRNLAEEDACAETLVRLRRRLVQHAKEGDDERHSTGKVFWEKRQDLIRSIDETVY